MSELAHFYWFIIGLGVIFIVVSAGLHWRTRWMWYLGWVLMFLLSGAMGGVFVTGMLAAVNGTQVLNGLIYLGIGLAIWVPVAVWWSNHRGRFGAGKDGPKRNESDSTFPED
jgi:hypothetical protein